MLSSASSHMDVAYRNKCYLVLAQDIWCDSSAIRCAILGWMSTEPISLTLEIFRVELGHRRWPCSEMSAFKPNSVGGDFSPSFSLALSRFPSSLPLFLFSYALPSTFKDCLCCVIHCSELRQYCRQTCHLLVVAEVPHSSFQSNNRPFTQRIELDIGIMDRGSLLLSQM